MASSGKSSSRAGSSFCDVSVYPRMSVQKESGGFTSREIEKSARRLVTPHGRFFLLKDLAFKPTGVALGRPLPDDCLADQLWSAAQILDRFLGIIQPSRCRHFGFVPKSWYHVTVVNWTHFDDSPTVTNMPKRELPVVRDALTAAVQKKEVSVRFAGLLLTKEGRLLVPGYPQDTSVARMRQDLSRAHQAFASHLPPAAHIKLGHILVNVKNKSFAAVCELVALLGRQINASVLFRDLYTPAGRIPFGVP